MGTSLSDKYTERGYQIAAGEILEALGIEFKDSSTVRIECTGGTQVRQPYTLSDGHESFHVAWASITVRDKA